MEDTLDVSLEHHGAGQTQEDPEGRVVTRKAVGGAAKSNQLLLRPTGCGPDVRESGVSVPTLEGQANTTDAAVAASATANSSHTSNL